MFGSTFADFIFYKPSANGYTYVLKYKGGNEKQHTTVNNYITQLDDTMKLNERSEGTFFHSINDDHTLPGTKVLSFDRDGRKANPIYRQLFDRKDTVLSGVTCWMKDVEEAEESSGEDGEGVLGETSDDDNIQIQHEEDEQGGSSRNQTGTQSRKRTKSSSTSAPLQVEGCYYTTTIIFGTECNCVLFLTGRGDQSSANSSDYRRGSGEGA